VIRRFVRSVIHNAMVTTGDGSSAMSLRIDPVLMQAMEVRPFEEVEIVNIATGDRFVTWIEEGETGEVRVRHVRAGDVITILSTALLQDGQTLSHRAKSITLDALNRIVSLTES
jgi:aspartate 1-decarboxylase